MNIELLKQVRDRIADEQCSVGFDMTDYGANDDPYCGTTACIGGHAIMLGARNRWRWNEFGAMEPRGREVEEVGDLAAEVLGLGHADAGYLFNGGWHLDKCLDEITRAEAVAYLDRCIAAGTVVRV